MYSRLFEASVSTLGASSKWVMEKNPLPKLRCRRSHNTLKLSRSSDVVRLLCHGKERPLMSP